MITNEHGIVSASRDELLAVWTFDDDLFRMFAFSEWLMWARIVGVKVHG